MNPVETPDTPTQGSSRDPPGSDSEAPPAKKARTEDKKDQKEEEPKGEKTKEAGEAPGEDEPAAGDEGVTMLDVLKDEEELEADANAVLGPADHKFCTYFSQGYSRRQALYSCLTCSVPSAPSFDPAGVCLACSYHCHEGHELVELYTKRNFRCDCGNKKFPAENKCKLAEEKAKINEDNSYNQNFRGKYCICARPYPDPEDPIEDEMIQCIVCEDWLHGRHLGMPKEDLPADESYSEMICVGCVTKNPFLMAYAGHAVTKVGKKDAAKLDQSTLSVDVGGSELLSESNVALHGSFNESATAADTSVLSETGDGGPAKECSVSQFEEGSVPPRTLFMSGAWRKALCACAKCKAKLEARKVSFLYDLEDTVHHYEAQSKKEGAAGSGYEEGLKALSELDRVKQVEAIQSYNTMKSGLMDYFKSFAEGKKVVTADDVKTFFEKMKAGKKGPQVQMNNFCK